MRLLYSLPLAFILSGCAAHPLAGYFTPGDQRLFVRGMEQLEDGGEPAAFAELQSAYPDSPWADRARKISQLQKTLHKRQQTLDTLTRERRACRHAQADLQKRIDALESERKKLRRLLIDLERRGR